MDIRKVKKLIELLDESGIAEIEITEGEESVRISRYPQGTAVTQVAAPAAMPVAAPPPAAPAAAVGESPPAAAARLGRCVQRFRCRLGRRLADQGFVLLHALFRAS